MVKNILIPTDFCVASLNTLKQAMEVDGTQDISVVLAYAEYLSDSEMDLLFYSPSKIINEKLRPEFKEAIEILRNRYSNLKKISIKLFHGNSLGYLENFISANNIAEIYLPKSYRFRTQGRSFDPVKLFRQSSVRVVEKDWEQYLNKSEQEHLIALFNQWRLT